MSCVNSAIITPVLAAGSTTSPYTYLINVTQRLCSACCVDTPPVFAPQFTLVGYSALGGTAYAATVQVQGIISYKACGSNCCCFKQQPLSQTFTIPFESATAPTNVAIEAAGGTINVISAAPCQNCSRSFVSETPLSISVG